LAPGGDDEEVEDEDEALATWFSEPKVLAICCMTLFDLNVICPDGRELARQV
jgi:hypothetical protein